MKSLSALYQALLHALSQAQRRRADARALTQMDARELQDLGVGRGELGYWLVQVTGQRSQSGDEKDHAPPRRYRPVCRPHPV